jgi:hypothetical protein
MEITIKAPIESSISKRFERLSKMSTMPKLRHKSKVENQGNREKNRRLKQLKSN